MTRLTVNGKIFVVRIPIIFSAANEGTYFLQALTNLEVVETHFKLSVRVIPLAPPKFLGIVPAVPPVRIPNFGL